MKKTVKHLHEEGLVKNGNLNSWSSHKLRHVFKTEAKHSGVGSEVVEFFMGHGKEKVKRVYDHTDEVHEEDLIEAYKKIEPYISLNLNEITAQEKIEKKEKEFHNILTNFQKATEEQINEKVKESQQQILATLLGNPKITKTPEQVLSVVQDKFGKLTTEEKEDVAIGVVEKNIPFNQRVLSDFFRRRADVL